MTQRPWHAAEVQEAADRLSVDLDTGLSSADAASRLEDVGPNRLIDRGGRGARGILWDQVSSVMVWLLLAAVVASVLLGDFTDAAAILAIVVLNVALGFRQEYRAEKAMAALKRLSVPTVKVVRDGSVKEISAHALVPGDVVRLEMGNVVPADGRVITAVSLRAQESALTGESQDVGKTAEPVGDAARADADVPLGDRRSMVYTGTVITHGRGTFVVTDTGMRTELGAVASMIQAVGREQTPLQKRLDHLGRVLAVVALALVAVIFVTGLVRGEDLELMFMTAISMAVAAVPEGLPAVVTIALALGAQRMLRRRALIRRLPAVETLGSVTVICSDKTGTLTANTMTVSRLEVADRTVVLDVGEGAALSRGSGGPDHPADPLVDLILAGSALCTDASLVAAGDASGVESAGERGQPVLGDPTEAALVMAAARRGLPKDRLEQVFPRLEEVPFDPARRRMSTRHVVPGAETVVGAAVGPSECLLAALKSLEGSDPSTAEGADVVFVKGAADALLERSVLVVTASGVVTLDEDRSAELLAANDRLAGAGMRVLGFAFRRMSVAQAEHGSAPADSGAPTSELESDLTFVGLIGLVDPPRPEAVEAVDRCRAAGIRPLMITGDHPATARFIAGELGIPTDGGVLTGADLSRMSFGELADRVEGCSVYARVAPENKLDIVSALEESGHVVAMTGDGVNDAPALKKADIGVAMGVTGTDVAKEAADMVLLDDNFATIVAAVEEGRVIYDNVRKFIKYILTSNSGELAVMIIAPFLGLPLPLLPLQILWINLVTDGLPALALSLEPGERRTMRRPPYPPGEGIFGRGLGRHVLVIGIVMGLVSLGAGYLYWRADHASWQTIVFTTLTLSQMGLALAVRSESDPLYRIGFFSNPPLVGSVVLTFLLQLAVIYWAPLQSVFKTVALEPVDLLVTLALSSIVFWAAEAQKLIAGGGRPRPAR